MYIDCANEGKCIGIRPPYQDTHTLQLATNHNATQPAFKHGACSETSLSPETAHRCMPIAMLSNQPKRGVSSIAKNRAYLLISSTGKDLCMGCRSRLQSVKRCRPTIHATKSITTVNHMAQCEACLQRRSVQVATVQLAGQLQVATAKRLQAVHTATGY